jgi:predicted DNA-binding transcriptional regulator YafY
VKSIVQLVTQVAPPSVENACSQRAAAGDTSAQTNRTRTLAAYWTAYQRDFHDRLYRAEALVRLAPGVTLPRAVNTRTEEGGWTVARVPVESLEHACGEFLRLGSAVEVLEPPELRAHIARTVAELAERYGNSAQKCDD